MRTSSAMKLLSASYGGFLMTVPLAPVDAAKAFWDFRSDADRANADNLGCVDPSGNKNRYLQIEVFDYNYAPWIEATWTQISDECGNPLGPGGGGATWTMEYYAGEDVPLGSIYTAENDLTPDGGTFGFITDERLQMDMYICAPWGNYELIVKTKSSNDGNDMEYIAWEVEYGPDEYHTWDTLNTPFLDGYKETNDVYPAGSGTRNEADPDADVPGYAPIPPDGDIAGITTYKWPLDGAEGYYSLMYSGPFPPLTGDDCPNLLPPGVTYEGCYPKGWNADWTEMDAATGTDNFKDPAEPYRLYDGFADAGVEEDGVMTLEKCKGICAGYNYFGLQSSIMCRCGDEVQGTDLENCGIADDDRIPEHKFLCSGDSRVLCGTNARISVYKIEEEEDTPAPTPSSDDYVELGCAQDNVNGVRVMPAGPFKLPALSAEICYEYCADALPTFEYFGTQFAFECFCAESISSDVTYGHDGCTAPCKGNPGEICGGTDAVTVYQVAKYRELGCVKDLVGGVRVMPAGPFNLPVMSAEICYDYCEGALPSFEYFGTQFAFQCFCAESIAGVTYGHDGCNKECQGTPGEICGGNKALTVYQVGDAPAPTPAPEGDFGEKGCAEDNVGGVRLMPVGPFALSAMSAQICYNTCVMEMPEFEYFGTQYAFECFCAESLAGVTYGHDGCTAPCQGNPGETCGGFNAMTIYQVGEAKPYTEEGCFVDSAADRIMEKFVPGLSKNSPMSPDICYEACIGIDPTYEYFGVQFKWQCFCSKNFDPTAEVDAPPAECTLACSQNSDEDCGGSNRMLTYKID